MTDIALRSVGELARAIRDREISSRDLLEHYVARVERFNPQLNAVVTLDLERARQRAEAADAALQRGEIRGPLHGIPLTVKDCIETAGLRTTAGASQYAEHVPATDAPTVRRLVAAGAIIFGKTNTPSLAMDCQTYNPVFGTTNNPWDLRRAPGGSSGGAAAAVAAGLTAFEVGSDIGGSIRNPAHYCGVYGHKPTYGIVASTGHIPFPPGARVEPDINVLGPLARSAADLELTLDVLAAPDDDRAVAWQLRLPPPRRRSLREYRVAAWFEDAACPLDAAVRERFDAAVAALRAVGTQVDEEARPGFDLGAAFRDYQQLLYPITSATLPDEQFRSIVVYADQMAAEADDQAARFMRFSTQRHRDWLAAHERRAGYRAQWATFFQRYDVLLCPITPVTAILHDQASEFLSRRIQVNGAARPYTDQIIWAGVIGMAYLPATVAPVGRTTAGLPVGIQIVGPYLEDRTSIDFARALADVVGGYETPPAYA